MIKYLYGVVCNCSKAHKKDAKDTQKLLQGGKRTNYTNVNRKH